MNRQVAMKTAVLFAAGLVGMLTAPMALAVGHGAPSRLAVTLPLYFEPAPRPAPFDFIARGPGYTAFLDSRGVLVKVGGRATGTGSSRKTALVRINLLRSSMNAFADGLHRKVGSVNYLLGRSADDWRTNVPTYERVRYASVYEGVDIVYYGNGGQLEFDLFVTPLTDPSSIAFAVEGATSVRAGTHGELVINTVAGPLTLQKPHAYQEKGGRRVPVAARYVRRADGAIAFRLGDYDRRRALVIDPTLTYSSFVAVTDNISAGGIAVDSAGNMYIAGRTGDARLPVTVGALQPRIANSIDYYVMKLNAAGTELMYLTYLGGTANETRNGRIAVDAAGAVYLVGGTDSTDFPVQDALQSRSAGDEDVIIAKLNAAGSALVYSTYLGGRGLDYGLYIAVDPSGSAYIAGSSSSADFPLSTGAIQQCGGVSSTTFVAKLESSGRRLSYSTCFGDRQTISNTSPGGIAVDSAGHAYVGGSTSWANFPVTAGAMQTRHAGAGDGFLAKVNPTGTGFVYATFVGGSGGDGVSAVTIDPDGNAYVCGSTTSTNLPITQGVFQPAASSGGDVFIARIGPQGDTASFLTYLGGREREYCDGIGFDAAGNSYMTGTTISRDFPLRNALQTQGPTNYYIPFISSLNATGAAMLYSTYLGGGNGHHAVAGVSVDGQGNAYIAGSTVGTFPTTETARFRSGPGVYVARIALENVRPTVSAISPLRAVIGSAALTLNITGTGFMPGSTVRLAGSARTTVYESPTRLRADIPAADLAQVGTVPVTVFNGPPGGGESDPVIFTVDPYPVPQITSLTPSSIRAGSAEFTLVVTGTNFARPSVVRWNGADRPTTFSNDRQLTARITAADVAEPGRVAITVFTPEPGGGVSSEFSVEVMANPVPAIRSIVPQQVIVGSGPVSITVQGTGFIASSTARFNAEARPTTFLGETQLSMRLTTADTAQIGSGEVTVLNAAPGGGVSNAVLLSIVAVPPNPVPVITSIAPPSLPLNAGQFQLSVGGSGFVGGAVVRWNGADRPTTRISAGELRATIAPDDTAAVGTAEVTVYNPPSVGGGGGVSAPALFRVTVNPVPILSPSSGDSLPIASGGTRLRVTGSNFVRTSRVRWNGGDRDTSYESRDILFADLRAGDLERPGMNVITVHNPDPAGGTSNGLPMFTVVPIGATDLAYDVGTRKLYILVPPASGQTSSSIVSVDPETGALSQPVTLGGRGQRFVLAHGGRYLYIVVDDPGGVRRFDLETQSAGPLYTTGSLRAIVAVPGNAEAFVAVGRDNRITLYESGQPRSASVITNATQFAFGASSSVLYGTERSSTIYIFSVGPTGIAAGTDIVSPGSPQFGNDLVFDAGLLLSANGTVFDTVTGRFPERFALSGEARTVAVERSANRAYFFSAGVSVYDLAARNFLWRLPVGSGTGTCLRWGMDGMACGGADRLYVFRLPATAPVANPDGVVNAASYAAGQPVAPGSIVSVFGPALALHTAAAELTPLPVSLGGLQLSTVRLGTEFRVPFFFASPTQVNIQIPWELSGSTTAGLFPVINGVSGTPITLRLAEYSPGFFTMTRTGRGQGAILDREGRVVDENAPARAGDTLQMFLTGLGRVNGPLITGVPAPTTSLVTTVATPSVLIGGVEARVTFSGLAPGFVGLYQVNVEVPASVPTGNAVPVVLRIGGVSSNEVSVALR